MTTSKGSAHYALALLTLVVLLNFLDRQIVAILAEPIKRDLNLTDSQVGLMAGLSFALLYTTLGIPLAWLADRWRRPQIIAISIALWSAMTVLCGMAGNFFQLFLARVGVGVGEAGSGPASHSLLSDLFPPERRAGAFGVYGLGIPVGAFVAYAGGGWIVENFDWRTAFVLAGAPGLIVAALVALTLKEPRRQAGSAPAPAPPPGALRALAQKSTYWHLVAGATLVAFVAYGFASFYGAFFVRIHGMGYGELGVALGVMVGISGALGAWLGGVVADRARKRAVGAVLAIPGIILIAAAPFFLAGLYIEEKYASIALLAAPTIAATFYYGPTFSSVQGLALPHTRAMAAAVFVFISSLIGMGLGPVFAGALSDTFAAQAFAQVDARAFADACALALGEGRAAGCAAAEASAIRSAIVTLSFFNLWAAAHFLLAARTLRRDLADEQAV
ncbi:MAG: MFS transporter [Alphaproteobacteria bacterium]|nr:MFS transporter [Alphaproteobacteria bacterium]